MTSEPPSVWRLALVRELHRLRGELHDLASPLTEDQFWCKPIEPGNSFGHLVLHLTGNLNHFAGAALANTGYLRDREREFTETSLPSREVALAQLDEAIAIYCRVVETIPDERLNEEHPFVKNTVADFLVRLVTHFALHRGQISYIGRLVQQR